MISKNTTYRTLEALRRHDSQEAANSHYRRIISQLRYVSALSLARDGEYDKLITEAAGNLAGDIADHGCTTAAMAVKTEKALDSLGGPAKNYEFICVAHAHIDMNWKWGFDETVATSLATMQTMLNLMDEYPDFVFSQSQAAVYRIVEQYAPAMFERIKERIREGRWEVLASTWVETDKNLPNGESLSRHILYTKQYFKETFDIPGSALTIDFEPDTFGHNRNVPEICASGGVKYYYHCRGQIGEQVAYRWRSPSGAELLLYTEPFWYNNGIDSTIAQYVPELCSLTGITTCLNVYGVGNHGGGPTRRDINRIIEMNSWPLFPAFRFGKMIDYFTQLEQSRTTLPIISDEINFICDGCYTSQSRIKAGNRKGEQLLADAEFYAGTAALMTDASYPAESLAEAWKKVLFNQFHDILPGSGVTETREYALGQYQEVFAAAQSARTLALEALTSRIRLDGFAVCEHTDDSRAEGAGAGTDQTARSAGKRRIYHIFNSVPQDRDEVVEIKVWDYEGDSAHIAAEDWTGKQLPFQKGESGNYWGHRYDNLLVRIQVPACGYTTVIIDEKPDYTPRVRFFSDIQNMQIKHPDSFVLENEFIQAELDRFDGSLVTFTDKETGTKISVKKGFGIFRLATESINVSVSGWKRNMSSWFTGRYTKLEKLNRNVELRLHTAGPVRTAWRMQFSFGTGSKMDAVISLDSGSRMLRYELICDWRELGSEHGIPNLHFHVPLGWKPSYLFDLPFGMTERAPVDMDMPAESFVLAGSPPGAPHKGSYLALFSRDKYAFRCFDDHFSLTLIRGTDCPDLTPEIDRHRISFALSPVQPSVSRRDMALQSLAYRRPMQVVSAQNRPVPTGDMEPSGNFFRVKGGILSVIKAPDGDAGNPGGAKSKSLVLRVYEAEGRETISEISLPIRAVSAFITDATEEHRRQDEDCKLTADGKTLCLKLPPFSVRTAVVVW